MTDFLVKQEGLFVIYEPIIKPVEPEPEIKPEILALARQLRDVYFQLETDDFDFDLLHSDERIAWINVAQFMSNINSSK